MFVTYEEVDVTWTAVNNWSLAAKLLSLSTSLILAEKYPNVLLPTPLFWIAITERNC